MGARRATTGNAGNLLERIGYEAGLEAEGHRRLAALDVAGCRTRLGRLVAGLEFEGLDGRQREVVALIADILHQVNRQVHGGDLADPTFQASRAALLERFAAHETAAAARADFLPALNALLATLGEGGRALHGVAGRARRYIDANYHRRIFLSSVANELSVSPDYLSRLFHEEVGVTLTAYIHAKRVERARLMLAEGRHSLAEIADQVGYGTYRNFYRNFVRVEGASPGQAKRRLRERARQSRVATVDP